MFDKKYQDEVYTGYEFVAAKHCAIRDCTEQIDLFWYVWITVSGKEKRLRFCSTHGPNESRYEHLYRIGL